MYGDALTTKARIKDRIKISTTDFDDLIDTFILAVTSRIQQMCGRRFIEGTYTNELHDGGDIYGTRRIFLIPKNAPLQSVSSISYKAGTTTTPDWTTISADDYDVDLTAGLIRFHYPLPIGFQNIRITYTGGYSGYLIGLNDYWVFNATPTGDVDGANLTFTLTEDADQVIVYVDGLREAAANVTFTEGEDSFTLAAGRAPFSTIAVDYLRTSDATNADLNLPPDLVDVCERAVVYLFKMRESEGKTTETFSESSITWRDSMFTKDMKATIANYRRGYNL